MLGFILLDLAVSYHTSVDYTLILKFLVGIYPTGFSSKLLHYSIDYTLILKKLVNIQFLSSFKACVFLQLSLV